MQVGNLLGSPGSSPELEVEEKLSETFSNHRPARVNKSFSDGDNLVTGGPIHPDYFFFFAALKFNLSVCVIGAPLLGV